MQGNNQLISANPDQDWIVPALIGVGAIALFKNTGAAQELQGWLHKKATVDGEWTSAILVYSAIVAATFLIGYKWPASRPALISWYVL